MSQCWCILATSINWPVHKSCRAATCPAAEIRERGKRLLKFLEKRWHIQFPNDETRQALLFFGSTDDDGNDEGEPL
jgi:hypothetical protein